MKSAFTTAGIVLYSALARGTAAARRRMSAAGGDGGQATAEYALVLLGAAAVALLVVSWAVGTDKIASLFDAVVDSIIGKVL